mmetsp:Transcript_38894/g.91591  ORF Transcript_38894/g.91591 Transcript_38894/m.91591 type:complete len:238 (-) Transcript_38894:198-911(-)
MSSSHYSCEQLAEVARDTKVLEQARGNAQSDREAVLAVLQQNGLALKEATLEIRADPAAVLAALSSQGEALQYASQDLRSDKVIVFAAVKMSGAALRHASEALCADRDIVLAAAQQCGSALMWANQKFLEDEEIMQCVSRQWIFRVRMLSGRSCVIVYDDVDNVSKLDFLQHASALLDLNYEQRTTTEALYQSEPIEDGMLVEWAAELQGEVIETQLLTSQRKHPRLELLYLRGSVT